MPTGIIQTFTGKMVRPLELKPEDIDIRDIAHALSMKCRFTGHCRRFYSVAEHCVWCVDNARQAPLAVQLWTLLHDAAEAYLPDIAGPIKGRVLIASPRVEDLGKPSPIGFEVVEWRILNAVGEAFGLPKLHPAQWEFIRNVDRRALATEKRDIMAHQIHWDELHNVEPFIDPVECWTPEEAEKTFAFAFAQIAGEMP